MQVGFSQGLKPLFIRICAILIGVCYLLNPLHDQLNEFLHTVSHAFELEHVSIDSSSIVKSDHHDYDYHEHASQTEHHDHFVIDLLDLVFSGTEDHNGSHESLITQLKIDKHIILSSYEHMNQLSYRVEHLFLNPSQKTEKGILRTQEKPPKNHLA